MSRVPAIFHVRRAIYVTTLIVEAELVKLRRIPTDHTPIGTYFSFFARSRLETMRPTVTPDVIG